MHEHSIASSRVQCLLLTIRFFEYREVRKQHNGTRYPERYRAGYHCVRLIDYEIAFVIFSIFHMLTGRVPAQEYWGVRYCYRT